MSKFLFKITCLVATISFSTAFGDVKLERFVFKLVPGQNGFRLEVDGRLESKGTIRVYNGLSKQYDTLDVIESKSGKQQDSLTLGNKDYELRFNFTPQGSLVLATGEIVNLGNKELLLQPELILNVPRTGEDFFYNGLDTLPAEGEEMSRMGMKNRPVAQIGSTATPFPMASLVGPRLSFFAGHVRFDPVSYNGAKLIPLENNRAEVVFLQRHAVGAGRRQTTRFVVGITPTRYGREEGVVQVMYDSFPDLFEPVVGQENPYIWGTHSQYRAWYFKPNYERERRYYSRVEWGYAPYKRSGDIYGHENLWDYTPLARDFKITFPAHVAGQVFDYKNISHAEFHRRRRDIFQRYAHDFGYAFYPTTAGVWCEYALARERYPDAIVEDTDGVRMVYENGWSTGHDKEIRVCPMGTSWAEVLREDMRRIHEELNPPGYALDGTGGGAHYRGPAAQNPDMPGRAWDDKGVFIDQAVAVADFVSFIHNDLIPGAEPRDKPFVWGNGNAVKADYYMIEATIFSPIFHSWMPNARYNIGPIPCVMHGNGYLIDDTIPDWRNMSREKFIEALTRLTVYSVFNGFRYGMSSNHVTNNGNPLEVYCIPELLELKRLGWQALVPADCYNQERIMYKARFGRGEDTTFFFGNPYAEPMPADFNIGNEFLGESQYVFVRKMRDHASTENKLKNGETFFNETLAPRIPYLYEAVCGLTSVPAGGLTVTAGSVKDINRIRFTLDFSNNPRFRTDILPRGIRDFEIESIKLDGKAVQPENCEIPPNARLVFEYRSTQFLTAAAEILDFPFVDAQNRPSFSVQVPAEPNEAEIKQAGRIQGYFRFFQEREITSPGRVWLVRSDTQPQRATVRILIGRECAEPSGVSRKGHEILIKADTPREADELVRQLSHVMDRRFEYFPPFSPVNSMRKEMLEQFDILGKHLPFIRCFETDKM